MSVPYNENGIYSMIDWRQPSRNPPVYRLGNSMIRIQVQVFLCLIVTVVVFLLILFNSLGVQSTGLLQYGFFGRSSRNEDIDIFLSSFNTAYNITYPLTKPVSDHNVVKYRIGFISDLDHSSKSKSAKDVWESYFLKGYFYWNPVEMIGSIVLDKTEPVKLQSSYSFKGRGMELSELVTFDGKLITIDDRSGIVYSIEEDQAYTWIVLSDGNGKINKGFKAEWASVKDEKLYIGGMGKEWTTPEGEFINYNPMWIKIVNKAGEIRHVDWTEHYKAVRLKLGIQFPGYVLHESCVWSPYKRKWFFLPRRKSSESYNEVNDETQGTNVLLIASEDFSDIEVRYIGDVVPTHGFSSFKFIPGTNDEVIVALKTVEFKGHTETYFMVFTINGNVLLKEKKIADVKYEGLEFI